MRAFFFGLTAILAVGLIACTNGTIASEFTPIAAESNSESPATTELTSTTEPAILAADPTFAPPSHRHHDPSQPCHGCNDRSDCHSHAWHPLRCLDTIPRSNNLSNGHRATSQPNQNRLPVG